jgi:hypothetical protein
MVMTLFAPLATPIFDGTASLDTNTGLWNFSQDATVTGDRGIQTL